MTAPAVITLRQTLLHMADDAIDGRREARRTCADCLRWHKPCPDHRTGDYEAARTIIASAQPEGTPA